MSPHGIIKTEPKEIENKLTQKSDKSIIWYLIIGIIVIISSVAIGSWWAVNEYKVEDSTVMKSLAILPLRNFTGNENQAYLAAGLHSNLITQISRISSLRTIPLRSTLKYENSEKSVSVIAKELGVDAIIEANIMEFGDSVQLDVQLIEVFPKERNVWAKIFVQSTSNIYSLYNEISKKIAEEMDLTLTQQEESNFSNAREVNPEAYKAYLKGLFYWMKPTPKNLDQSLKYFELAIQIDPDYAAGYAGIAQVWGARIQQGIIPGIKIIPKLDSLMSKALELDNSLMEVHYSIALYNTWVKWDWKRADQSFKKAIELNPNNAGAHAFYSHLLFITGKPEEALLEINEALRLDPLNPLYQAIYGMDLNYGRKYSEVIDLLNNSLENAPDNPIALSTLRSAYHNNKEFEKAYEIFVRSYDVKNDKAAVLALKKGYSEGGYSNALNQLAELLIERTSIKYVTPWKIGTLYTRSGNNDEAIRYLKLAYNDHDSNMPYINIDPIFDDLKNYPEFRNLISQMNFPNSD
jgi:TolB-like protein/Tfp pilus assembly protein PilF